MREKNKSKVIRLKAREWESSSQHKKLLLYEVNEKYNTDDISSGLCNKYSHVMTSFGSLYDCKSLSIRWHTNNAHKNNIGINEGEWEREREGERAREACGNAYETSEMKFFVEWTRHTFTSHTHAEHRILWATKTPYRRRKKRKKEQKMEGGRVEGN